MNHCSIDGCGASIADHQANATEKRFGKAVCLTHEKDAAAEASKHDNAFTINTAPYVKCGFVIQDGIAAKVIKHEDGQAEVTIDIAKLAVGKTKKESIQVGGYDYEFGLNPVVDAELKTLIVMIWRKGGVGKNDKKEMPAPPSQSMNRKECVDGTNEVMVKTESVSLKSVLSVPDKNKSSSTEHSERQPSSKPQRESSESAVHRQNIGTRDTKTRPDAHESALAFAPRGNMIKGFVPQLKEIGKIKIGRKGEKKTSSGYRLPEKFDHFEIMSVIRDENGNFVPDPIMATLGNKPKELNIMLLYNDPTLCFSTRYNVYKGGKCLCSGDGVTAKVSVPDQEGNLIIDCDPETCPQLKDKKCKPNGILSVILTDSPRLGGVYKFRTTSYNSIWSILSSLFFLRSLTGGVLAMIPLKLTISPMTVQPKDAQTAQTIYVVNVEFSGTAQQLLEKTVEVAKYQGNLRAEIQTLEATARLSLDTPESEEEIRDVEAEYYPEVV